MPWIRTAETSVRESTSPLVKERTHQFQTDNVKHGPRSLTKGTTHPFSQKPEIR